jgi:hypothetical protein
MNEQLDRDDKLMRKVAELTTTELENFCTFHKLERAGENRALAPSCKKAVARAARALRDPPALNSLAFGEKHGWRGLGSVDLVMRWANRRPVFLELKCDELSPCVWDAVKLATAVLGGNAGSGYLLASARTSDWEKPIAGSQFFETAEWTTLGTDVRDRFLSSWRRWEREGHIPGRVPTGFSTVALGVFSLTIAGVPWEVRLARLCASGAWIWWPPIERQLEPPDVPCDSKQRLVGEQAALMPLDGDELKRRLRR